MTLEEVLNLTFTYRDLREVIDIFWEKEYSKEMHPDVYRRRTSKGILQALYNDSFYLSTYRAKPLGVDSPGLILKTLLMPFKKIPLELKTENLLVREAYVWRLRNGK